MTVMAATAWHNNAQMIEDVARLGYLRKEWHTLDPTYGRGLWWKNWRPDNLVIHDLAVDEVDFRKLPHSDGEFDAVAFDPPYVSVGGRTTTGLPDLFARYGMTDAPRTPHDLQLLINEGMWEQHRVLKQGGIMLVKCQPYISSGKFFPGDFLTQEHAVRTMNMETIDRLDMVMRARPQPGDRRRKARKGDDPSLVDEDGMVASTQQHARRNLSTLFVFRTR